uniref:ABC transporter permease n=1 Tax=Ignisphaera aggregans TaxID=334771 RepID=A0A7J3QFC0_9CREN
MSVDISKRRNIFIYAIRDRYFMLLLSIFIGLVIIGAIGPIFVKSPSRVVGARLQPPSREFILGTDALGRDVFAQIIHGIRNSLLIGLFAGLIGIAIATTLGILSGFLKGLIGDALTTIINMFMLIPQIPLLLLIASAIRIRSMFFVAFLIGALFAWPAPARAIRALALSLREREFIDLAKISGKKSIEIAFKEIFPIISPYILLQFGTVYASAIFTETGISLIGLGPTNVVTLGWVLNQVLVMNAYVVGAWWWFIPPGIMVSLLVLSLYLMPLVLSKRLQQIGV